VPARGPGRVISIGGIVHVALRADDERCQQAFSARSGSIEAMAETERARVMLIGGCLCGAVRFEIDGALRHITHCHCSMCRKAHGAAFATYARLGRRRFRLVSGGDVLCRFVSSERVTREFCGRCGSSLFWLSDEEPDVVGVAIGTVEGDPGGRPEAHIYERDRACWVEIGDSLPRFAEGPPR
jgi:hypothetical protein